MMAGIEYLKSLEAVRERARVVLHAAQQGSLNHFEYHPESMPQVKDFVVGVIDRDFGPDRFDRIPPHGRWQHFNVGGVQRVERLLQEWDTNGCDKVEMVRRLIDLFFVSVLLDAGAGDTWKFVEPDTQAAYNRSEGIAVASLYMFLEGAFASTSDAIVDGRGLLDLSDDSFKRHFQVSAQNVIIGVSSRVGLLKSVGQSLLNLPELFGDSGRPGKLVDYLLENKKESDALDYRVLWTALQKLLLPSWPKDRTQIQGVPLGDAWPLNVLANRGKDPVDAIQPFHKLTQWLGYSLTTPFVSVLDVNWKNMELGTGLPEYRNGGLFVDLGVLQLKEKTLGEGRSQSQQSLPSFGASSDAIVEWRAMTVALLDELYKAVSQYYAEQGVRLSMAQMLEAGTWKGGRELAAKFRPETRSSPILIEGDGTLF